MPLSEAALEPLLRLALVPGVGPQRLAALLRALGSAERALAAGYELDRVPGLPPRVAREIRRSAAAGEAARRAMHSLRRSSAVAITPDDAAYPDAFRALPDPPYLLFASGRLEMLAAPAVALVGTRRP